MKLTDDDLKALYRERTEPATRDACPTADEMADLAAGARSAADRERLTGHLAACSACADEFRVLGELRPVIDGAARPRPAFDWRYLAAAAALVLVAGLAFVVWQSSRTNLPPRPIDRSGQTSQIETTPSNRATLDAAPAALSWTAVDGATGYRVTIYDFESTPVWESPLVRTSTVDVPEEVRARLRPGTPVYWRVVATGDYDRQELGPFQFSVTAGSGR